MRQEFHEIIQDSEVLKTIDAIEVGCLDLTHGNLDKFLYTNKNKYSSSIAFDLAQLLGAEVSASRPVVDSGWLPSARQVGSSGSTVSPKLYFSLGVSGAIQHVVGMKGSKNILAINKDRDAPIFEISDYAVVGNVLEIVPKLIEKLKESE